MTLAVGSTLGPYRITGAVGEGGMGHVFRATDSRIGRDVAIKVLPRSFASDPDRLRRFEQEARAAGMLNHPNLLTLFEFGSHDGAPYMVAELLEGETLRSLLSRGALRVSQAVEFAIEIAAGLAAAHDRGVVHRDLKPENIFITADERVKILDFGLAKLVRESAMHDQTAEYGSDSNSGLVVGTAGYMAPEQVRGQAVDHRADIFAFGAILYEMLCGARAFRKESAVETMNAILSEDPLPLTDLAPNVPASLERITRRCLQKNRDQRYQSARDLAFTLESFSTVSSSDRRAIVPVQKLRSRAALAALIAAVIAFAIGYGVAKWRAPRALDPPVVRYLTFSGRDNAPAASPDGRTVAFVSQRDGMSRIWLKQLSGGSEVALTSGPDVFPRFSPDASSVLFTRLEGERTSIWRVPAVGGEPHRLILGARDADFSPDGREIAFLRMVEAQPQASWQLWVAAPDGSNPRQLLATTERQLHSPRWSPDGSQIALIAEGDQITARLLIVGVDGKSQRFIKPAQNRGVLTSAAWSGPELIYAMSDASAAPSRGAGSTLYAHDPHSGSIRKLLSTPLTCSVVDRAGPGRLVIDYNSSTQNLSEVDLRLPNAALVQLTHGRSSDRQPVYSVDGSSIVFSSDRGGNLDLWVFSRATHSFKQLTDDPAEDWDPAFTPDGQRLLWSSNRAGHFEVWTAEKDGGDAHQLTHDGADAENPTETPDGWIVYTSFNTEKRGLWKIRRDGTVAQKLVSGRCLNPEVSPDGKYVAFHTDELYVSATIRVARVGDGRLTPFEARVRSPFGESIGRTRWTPDGRSVAFIAANELGHIGVWTQSFDPDRNLPETKKPFADAGSDEPVESFGISRDGALLSTSMVDQLSGVMTIDGVDIRTK